MGERMFAAKRAVSRLLAGGVANRVVGTDDGVTMILKQIVAADIAANAGIALGQLGVRAVAAKHLVLGSNLSTTLATFNEMSTVYRINHAISKAGNIVIVVAIVSVTLGAGESVGFTGFVDGVSFGVNYGAVQQSGSGNGVFGYAYAPVNTTARNYGLGWASGAAGVQVDHFGAGMSNGLMLLMEVNLS